MTFTVQYGHILNSLITPLQMHSECKLCFQDTSDRIITFLFILISQVLGEVTINVDQVTSYLTDNLHSAIPMVNTHVVNRVVGVVTQMAIASVVIA